MEDIPGNAKYLGLQVLHNGRVTLYARNSASVH